MIPLYDLPQPDDKALERSEALTTCIREAIENAQGSISFAQFMEMALYHPLFGYYNAESFTIGPQGDFITAPEISPLFAQCFATQCVQIFESLSASVVMELGAGTGKFAHDFLCELERKRFWPEQYYIYEISPGLRRQQQSFLKSACPQFFSKIKWLTKLPDRFKGIIVANEVLDALPVHRFRIHETKMDALNVTWEKNKFVCCSQKPDDVLTEQIIYLKKNYRLPANYQSEINLSLASFIQMIAESLAEGVILFSDYGDGQKDYYHPHRHMGTLKSFYKHLQMEDPLLLPGLQDITADVDFSAVIQAADTYGCQLAGYTTQAAFLTGCGLLKYAKEASEGTAGLEDVKLQQAIKLLTLPTEMGQRIKVMGLSKNFDVPLLGFNLESRIKDL